MPVIVTLLPCKSVTMNLQCYAILVGYFTVQLLNIAMP